MWSVLAEAVFIEDATALRGSIVALILTDLGGHLGFIEGISPYGPNFADRLFRQIAQNVFAA